MSADVSPCVIPLPFSAQATLHLALGGQDKEGKNRSLRSHDPLRVLRLVEEGKFDHLKKRFLRILARHGGKLDHSTLLKRLPVDATLFRRLVETLKMCDLIEDEVLPNGKRGYSLNAAA